MHLVSRLRPNIKYDKYASTKITLQQDLWSLLKRLPIVDNAMVFLAQSYQYKGLMLNSISRHVVREYSNQVESTHLCVQQFLLNSCLCYYYFYLSDRLRTRYFLLNDSFQISSIHYWFKEVCLYVF